MNTGELAQLMRSVGFPESSIPVGVAVAMGESSGNPRAFNGRGNDASYGLWQINMIGSLGPTRRVQFGLSRNEDLFDPTTNARAALAISNGGSSWNAWGAYTNGSYKRFLGSNVSGTPNPSPSGLPDLSSLPAINTPFGPVNPLLIGGALLLLLLLR